MLSDKNNFMNSHSEGLGDLFSQNEENGLESNSIEETDMVTDSIEEDMVLDFEETDMAIDSIEEDMILDFKETDMAIDSEEEDMAIDSEEEDMTIASEEEDMVIDSEEEDMVIDSEEDMLMDSQEENTFEKDLDLDFENVTKNVLEENKKDENILDFDLPKYMSSVIKVIGVGGGGSNAVNHMINEGIGGVDFVICNTDAQALEKGLAPIKIQLGVSLTEGLGAGENPNVGEQAALESEKDIVSILEKNTKMVFVTAGMGGGTGTGAAPIIAKICKDLDILTIGIVTVPFGFEGPKRFKQAQEGIEKMREYVDSLVVINNDKLVEVYGNLGLRSGFAKADETLMVAARGISEVITKNCLVNIDLNDAKTVLKDSGTAIMGYGKASGPNRAEDALLQALDSPLLNDNHIKGANKILLLILSGKDELTINEHAEINQYLQREAGGQANIILGVGDDEALDEEISVTIIATGVLSQDVDPTTGVEERKVHVLGEENKKEQEEQDFVESNDEIILKSDSSDGDKKENEHLHPQKNIIDFSKKNQCVDESSKPLDRNSILTDQITKENTNSLSEKNIQLAEDRKKRLQKFHNLNFKNQTVLKELEDEPAYKRQGVNLEEVESSSVEPNSRIVLDSSQEDLEIKSNNSFLHDNVD